MSGRQVEQVIEVTVMEGRDEASLHPRKGWLGVGHDERGGLFGEVMHADIGMPTFTQRCYRVDEYFEDGFAAQAAGQDLVLDAGTSRNMVVVPAPEMQRALTTLRKPVAALAPGDHVTVLRNSEHPAYKDQVEGEYGTDYVLRDDFQPLVAHNVALTERMNSSVRGANGFWYDQEGKQVGSEATMVVSEQSVSGAHLPVALPSEPVTPEPATTDRFDQATVALGEQITAYEGVVSQWNPHNEKMRPRIEEGRRLIDSAQTDLDHFGYLGRRFPEIPLIDAAEVARRRERVAEYLERSSAELSAGMDVIGVQLPVQPIAPSAEHIARLAELKRAPSRFEQPVSEHKTNTGASFA
ncbi:hypothetical protein [Streptomyces sp. NPDC052042]|uniref:hypothetical protein n=1 Tax=Streptomyces sp. NPDC052042 TaxID=3365683 RepID=UPI0037CF4E44